MNYQTKVKEFMVTFGQECPPKPTLSDVQTRVLRVKLLLEEVLELAEASGLRVVDSLGHDINTALLKSGKIEIVESPQLVPSLDGIADAIADISYVNYGAANAFGIDIEPIEDEVHASNMTKLFTTEEVDQMDRSEFKFKPVRMTGKCFLVKNNDGKVQKSPSYTPADIQKHLDAQLNG
jgi:predicted HAD superfamily Cof-like phosphohydrolase